jgi:hypothetical protein
LLPGGGLCGVVDRSGIIINTKWASFVVGLVILSVFVRAAIISISEKPKPSKVGVTYTFHQIIKNTKLVNRGKITEPCYVFRFTDRDGLSYKCELPLSESKGNLPIYVWEARFSAYRCEETQKLSINTNQDNLNDFPWPDYPNQGTYHLNPKGR